MCIVLSTYHVLFVYQIVVYDMHGMMLCCAVLSYVEAYTQLLWLDEGAAEVMHTENN